MLNFNLDEFMLYIRNEFPEPMKYHFTYDLLRNVMSNLIKNCSDKDYFVSSVMEIVPEIAECELITFLEEEPQKTESIKQPPAQANMAKKISRNDYYEMISKTGRIPKDDEYEILPLDFSEYHLNSDTQRIANINFSEETIDRNGNYMLRGHWLDDLCFAFAAKCNFELCVISSYSAYAYSDEQMALFTYCEGDITLTPHKTREEYEADKEEMLQFYEELEKD